MPKSRDELIEILEDYERNGWVILALPAEIAEPLFGVPATQMAALELSGRIARMERELALKGRAMIEPVKKEGYPDYWTVEGKEMTAHIERRPYYCDRGRFKVLIEPRGRFALSFDGQDGFPRYFFDWDRMLGELEDFMACREQLQEA